MTTTLTRPTETVTAHPVKRSSRFTWPAVLVVVLAVALGFGAGFLTSQLTQEEPTGLATDANVSLIEDHMAAYNAGDYNALAATTTPDFVFTVMDRNGVVGETTGPDATLLTLGDVSGLEATSEFMQQGDLVTSTYSESGSQGVQTYQITDGKISHAWITMDSTGPVVPTATGSGGGTNATVADYNLN